MSQLLEQAKNFHGHIGPFLILGLKAGLEVVKIAGKDPLNSFVEVRLPLQRPYTCFVDGVQLCTGCTLGKMNIKLVNTLDESILMTYVCNGKRVCLKVKDEILKFLILKLKNRYNMNKLAKEIWALPSSELFEISLFI